MRNFGQNLGAPFVLVNDVLQGNRGRAWTTTQRFVVNTTVGAAGLFDIASDWELPAHKADFGQTLGVWGVESGPRKFAQSRCNVGLGQALPLPRLVRFERTAFAFGERGSA